MSSTEVIVTATEMDAMLDRLAEAVAVRHPDPATLALVGIQRRGADIAERIKARLDARFGARVAFGKLDINLYRDDWTSLAHQPSIQCTQIPFDLTTYTVVLVDDVLFTGRTIRAALEAVLDYGRPRAVELLVLVDRGGRELPIQPDFVGTRVTTTPKDHVNVFVTERDDSDSISVTWA